MEFTQDEYEAFFIVKKIVSKRINPDRVMRSEAKSYLAVLLDNNSQKTICRLYLLGKKKYIGTLNARKVETKTQIRSIEEIMSFETPLNEIVRYYESV